MIGVNFPIPLFDECLFWHSWKPCHAIVWYSEEVGGFDIYERGRICKDCERREVWSVLDKKWLTPEQMEKLYCLQSVELVLK